MSDIRYEFLMSQLKVIRDMKENDKIKISLVLYAGSQVPCVLKVCKNRDLSAVCQTLMKVKHPNIVVIYDYAYANGDTYIVEEYMNGQTLESILLDQGAFSEQETAKLIMRVCDALSVLHKCEPPLVHNDINTSNIMVRDDGTIKLFDFDIARIYKSESSKNTTLFGTEEYASPEHFGYGQSEPRTDIYSLGVTMHKLLTGKGLDRQHKVLYDGKLKNVVRKCTQVDLKKRYQSVGLLKKDLEKFCRRGQSVLYKVAMLLLLLVSGILVMTLAEPFGKKVAGGMQESTQMVGNMEQSEQMEHTKLTGQTSKVDETSEYTESKTEELTEKISEQKQEEPSSEVRKTEQKQEEPSSEVGTTASRQEETVKAEEPVDEQKNVVQSIGKASDGSNVYSMVTLNDGTAAWLEIDLSSGSPRGYLRMEHGVGELTGDLGTGENFELVYDKYHDRLFILTQILEGFTDIYEMDEYFAVTKVGSYSTNTGSYDVNWRDAKVSFFSDGVMYCDILETELIDTKTWVEHGNADAKVHAILDDKMYVLKWNGERFDYTIAEVDASGRILQEYRISDTNYSFDIKMDKSYSDGEYLYFIANVLDRDYVYRFDGEQCEIILCLNDCRYYSKTNYESLCVTREAVWYFDASTGVVKKIGY